jgi:serine/threonine-protein kinase
MSPEQASGEHKLDRRSDIYALGCVLYEMLAGEPPHTGPTAQAIIAKRITEPAPRVTTVRETVPGPVADALERALARLPADRLAPANRFSEALTGPAAAPTAGVSTARRPAVRRSVIAYAAVAILAIIGAYTVISRTVGPPESAEAAALPRLAVLPFENLGSLEDDYFADGITEEITSRIAEISGLHVKSRTSTMQYKNHEKTLQQIGEELNVDYVLEGTIRTDRAPNGSGQVRVTPQLIRVSDDAHLWTDRYTADLVPGEIFGVQEQIANQVAGALDVTLLEPERRRLAAQPTDNVEAYDYYLRGNDYFFNRGDQDQDARIAIQMYQMAVDLDPDFALAYARLSRVHSMMWFFFYDRTQERLAVAREAVDQALRLDPDLPEAHEALGMYYYHGHLDYERALAEFAIAQKSQPNSGDLLEATGYVQRRQGKFVEALANFKQAVELNPRSAPSADELAETYALVRNPVEAARYYDRAVSLSPDWAHPYAEKAKWVHLRLEGSTARARAVLEQARSVGLAQHPEIAYAWILLEIWDGDYRQALDRLALVSSDVLWEDQFLHVPYAQLYAQAYGLMGTRQLEQAYHDSARAILEAGIQQRPDDERYRSALGIAYAGLGRTADAIREGELAVELLPMSKEAWRGAYRVEDLARIYTMVGEYDAAIDRLETLLAVPSPMSVPMLRIDPTWNPLRNHPRFQALLEEYGN